MRGEPTTTGAVAAEIPGVGAGLVARMNSQLGNAHSRSWHLQGTGWLQLPPHGMWLFPSPSHFRTNCLPERHSSEEGVLGTQHQFVPCL